MKTTSFVFSIFSSLFFFSSCETIWPYERVDPECPVVLSISPTGARFGEVVTITGENFYLNDKTAYEVLINNTPIPEGNIIEIDTGSQILRFSVPIGQQDGSVEVRLKNHGDICNVIGNQPSPTIFTYYYTAANVIKFGIGTPNQNACGENCFNYPTGIDVDNSGNVYVCDKVNQVIRKFSSSGNQLEIIGKLQPFAPDCNQSPIFSKQDARFANPLDVEVDASGDIFVAEEYSSVIRRVNSSIGVSVVTGICFEPGSENGSCLTARLNVPYSIAKGSNIIYAIDNNKIRMIDVATPCSQVTSMTLSNRSLNAPIAIAYSLARTNSGPLYVVDQIERKIKSVNASGKVDDLVVSGNSLNEPISIDLDNRGNIFIADKGKHQILVLYTNGELILFSGTGEKNYLDNVTGLDAKFNTPSGIAYFEQGETKVLYISDTENHLIRKVEVL
ncbi:MAG: IPT/TIG domain-containing protein [Bacteroidia bacterium]|nr:IPT/TIG domain-containing protein [Bacteroidia bacterium]